MTVARTEDSSNGYGFAYFHWHSFKYPAAPAYSRDCQCYWRWVQFKQLQRSKHV